MSLISLSTGERRLEASVLLILTMRRELSHSTFPPITSPTNRNGTSVLPFMIWAGCSRFLCVPFTVAVLCPILKETELSAFLPVIVCVAESHVTVAPIVSNTVRTGTIARPPMRTGATSLATTRPSNSIVIGRAAEAETGINETKIPNVTRIITNLKYKALLFIDISSLSVFKYKWRITF